MSNNYFVFNSNISLKITKVLIVFLLIVISFCFMFPANALTQSIKLRSKNGYMVETIFSYDNNQGIKIIKEQGFGTSKVINSMKVSFYKPSGDLIASYDNITDGIIRSKYFEFNFDTLSQKLTGNIDLGGEFTGAMYLKGRAEQELSLVEIKATGTEKIIDQILQ